MVGLPGLLGRAQPDAIPPTPVTSTADAKSSFAGREPELGTSCQLTLNVPCAAASAVRNPSTAIE
jgi:hypothetical protein